VRRFACIVVFLAIVLGCASPPQQQGWFPKSKAEARQMIGSTVMEAIHQYHLWVLEQQRKAQEQRQKQLLQSYRKV